MRVLAHLSDLHFGRVDPAVLGPLRRRVRELAPDLVVVSGDLTQRARSRQFRAARAFLDTLPKPQVVVPGNHDLPLFNLFARLFAPLAGYRRFIAAEVDPIVVDDEIAVVGLNTARALRWKSGTIDEAQLARLRDKLSSLGGAVVKVLVTHHPVPRVPGVDVVLSGHLHATRVEEGAALVVQGGTAASRRTRTESNSFNLLRIARERIEVEQHALRGASFVRVARRAYGRQDGGWVALA